MSSFQYINGTFQNERVFKRTHCFKFISKIIIIIGITIIILKIIIIIILFKISHFTFHLFKIWICRKPNKGCHSFLHSNFS